MACRRIKIKINRKKIIKEEYVRRTRNSGLILYQARSRFFLLTHPRSNPNARSSTAFEAKGWFSDFWLFQSSMCSV